MSRILTLNSGDRALLKKTHPCGSREWEVMKATSDVRAKCLGCGRVTLLPRVRFERLVREFTRRADDASDQDNHQEA